MDIKLKLLSRDATLPTKSHKSDAGFDLYSPKDIKIKKGEKVIIPLSIASSFSSGYFVSIRDRSGLAAKYGLHVLGGVIDAGYRGEWKIVLINLGEDDYKIKKRDRIAQGVLHKIPDVRIRQVEKLPTSKRGDGGFGSSGR